MASSLQLFHYNTIKMRSFLTTNILFFIFFAGIVSSKSEIEYTELESSQYAVWNPIGELSSDVVKNAVKWVSELYQDKRYCPNGDEGSYDAFQGGDRDPVTIYTKMWASGENCDTSAERNIASSMWKQFEERYRNGENIYLPLPEAACLNSHGTFNTFLSFGTNRVKVYGQDCVNCVSGKPLTLSDSSDRKSVV